LEKNIQFHKKKHELTCQTRDPSNENDISHREKIKKKNCETQFLVNSILKDKIKKLIKKNKHKLIQVSLPNPQTRSWDHDNLTKSKLKKIMNPIFK